MKKFLILSLLLSFSAPVAFASNHDHCSCTQECKENCNKGKTADCECRDCECKESKNCH